MIPSIIRASKAIALLEHFTQSYFQTLFADDFKSITFGQKPNGVQTGCTATLYLRQNEVSKKYFVKTSLKNSADDGVLDPREIFVYVFLSKLIWSECTIGPEDIHFYFNYSNPFKEFYIATKDVKFETFQELANQSDFSQKFETDNNYSNGLLLADLISKILFLTDTTNNPANFGFTKDSKLKMIDFTINEDGLKDKDMLERFLKDDFISINKDNLSKYFRMKADKKIKLARDIFAHLEINQILEESKLKTLDLLDANFTKHFKDKKVYEYETIIHLKLITYINDVKESFRKFSIEFKV